MIIREPLQGCLEFPVGHDFAGVFIDMQMIPAGTLANEQGRRPGEQAFGEALGPDKTTEIEDRRIPISLVFLLR